MSTEFHAAEVFRIYRKLHAARKILADIIETVPVPESMRMEAIEALGHRYQRKLQLLKVTDDA